jgi:FkbM family methyltransferase
LPSQYNFLRWKNIEFYNKAVWTQDGTIDFYCSRVEGREELQSDARYTEFLKAHDEMVAKGDLVMAHQRDDVACDGSSTLVPDHMAKQLHSVGDELQKRLQWDTKVSVECFDFSKWLREHVLPGDSVLCKIDIEGGEFEVLDKLIRDDTLRLINKLDAEFHFFGNEAYAEKYNRQLAEIGRLGIQFEAW